MDDFIKTKAKDIAKVKITYAKGAPPELLMRDGSGKVAERVNVAEWKSDTIKEYLVDKLDDKERVEPLDGKGKKKKRRKDGAKAYDVTDPEADHAAEGTARDEEGDTEGALEAFTAAVKFAKGKGGATEADAHVNLGVALLHAGDVQGAHHSVMEALAIDPEHKVALENMEQINAYAQAYMSGQ